MVYQLFDNRLLFIQNPRIVLICLFAAIIRVMSVGSHTSDPPPQPKAAEQTQAEAKENAILTRAVIGAKQLHDSIRNPGSFQLSKVLVQNGFGGLMSATRCSHQAVNSRHRKMTASRVQWSKECAEKTGSDKTFAVDLLVLAVPASATVYLPRA